MEELIAVDTEAIFEVRNPIGIYGKICFTQGLFVQRLYRRCAYLSALPAHAFSEGEDSVPVIVFPKYGYRYHKRLPLCTAV